MNRDRARAVRALVVGLVLLASPCGIALCESRIALADELGTVAVVADDSPFAKRVRAELASLGFRIVERAARTPGDSLTLLFRTQNEALGIAVVYRGDVPIVAEDVRIDGGDAAVRVAEHLRAILQPLAEVVRREARVPDDAPAKPTTRAETPIRRWLVSLDLGPSFGGATPGGTFVLGFAAAPWSTERVRLGVDLGIPVIAEEIARSEGSTRVRSFFFAPALAFDAIRMRAFRFELGVRAGGALTTFVGVAAPSFEAADATKVVFLAMTDARVAFALGEHAEVSVGARLGSTFPGVDVRFAGASTETWGRPWMMPFVGGALRF